MLTTTGFPGERVARDVGSPRTGRPGGRIPANDARPKDPNGAAPSSLSNASCRGTYGLGTAEGAKALGGGLTGARCGDTGTALCPSASEIARNVRGRAAIESGTAAATFRLAKT